MIFSVTKFLRKENIPKNPLRIIFPMRKVITAHGDNSFLLPDPEIEITHFVKFDLVLGYKSVDLGINQLTDKFIDRYSGTFCASAVCLLC